MCMRVGTCMPQCKCGDQRTICKSSCSLSTKYIKGSNSGHQDCQYELLPHQAILLGLNKHISFQETDKIHQSGHCILVK